MFNEQGSKLLIHIRADSINSTSVLVGNLVDSTAGSAYGKALDITFPPPLAGAISLFKLTIPDSGYVQAICDSPTLKAQATTYFSNAPTTTDDHSVECSTLPDTTINSGPIGLTNDNTPTFTFSSSQPDSTFECRIDDGPFSACSGPGDSETTFALAEGPHSFAVRAINPALNPDPTPATRAFTVDTQAPETTINSGPSGLTNDNKPAFTFSSEAGASFECRLDGPGAATGTFGSCTSAKSYTDLANGTYTLQVRAIDSASNTDQSPASRSFTVDATSPDTTIDSGPIGLTNDNTPTFTFSSSQPDSTFECRIDDGPFSACSGPGDSETTFALAEGPHSFAVRATDPASNTDPTPATRTFTVDTTAPRPKITKKPKAKIKTGQKAVKVQVAFDSEPSAEVKCKLDKAGYKPCASPYKVKAKSEPGKGKKHTISVEATDLAGNQGSPATVSFRVIRKR